MDYYDARNEPPRRKKKKKKKKTNGPKCTITSVSENSVNVSERENAPFPDFNFLKTKSGAKIGVRAKKGENPDVTIK